MPSSGMRRLVDLVRTDVSEESIASNFGVEKSTRVRKVADICIETSVSKRLTFFSLTYFFTLKMEATHFSETSVITRFTRRHIPEDGILYAESGSTYGKHWDVCSRSNAMHEAISRPS
jgi:hypothetical protein